jgi:hypothetical protein
MALNAGISTIPGNEIIGRLFGSGYAGLGRRIWTVKGLFIMFGKGLFGQHSYVSPETKVGLSNRNSERKKIYKIAVAKESKEHILKQLGDIGISRARLFPELEHVSKYVKEHK